MAVLVMGEGGNSSELLPKQPIAAHFYMANFFRGVGSSKVLPMQFIAAHSYMAVSDRGVNSSKFFPF